MTVGERIKSIRKEKNMTQKQVADRCGMADSAIRKYESGQVTPKQETLHRIANALGVHILDLLGIGEQLDKHKVEISVSPNANISAEDLIKIHEIANENPRKTYDLLSEEDKTEFWNILSEVVSPSFTNTLTKNTPPISSEALKLAKDYDRLDTWGKETVKALVKMEQKRCSY